MKIKRVIFFLAVVMALVIVCSFAARCVFPLKYSEVIDEYADRFNLSEELLMGVIYAESRFDPTADSGRARGLMQITSDTAKWIAEELGMDFGEEMLDVPEINIKMGSYYLSYLIRYYKNVETALAAYNAGMGKVSEWLKDERYSRDGASLLEIPYAETKRYVKRVRNLQLVYDLLY